VVKTKDDYRAVSAKLLDIKELKKKAIELFKPAKTYAKKAHTAICDLENSIKRPLIEAEDLINPKRTEYVNEEERKRREKEFKLQEQARKQEEKLEAQRQKKIEQAQKKGDEETAQALEEAPLPCVSIPTVKSSVPEIKGGQNRVIWKARVIDIKLMPKRYKIEIPDQKALDQIAKEDKDKALVPGVEFYSEVIMAQQRRY